MFTQKKMDKKLDERLSRLYEHLQDHNAREIKQILAISGIDLTGKKAEAINESWNEHCSLVWDSIFKYMTGWKGWGTF